MLGRKRRFFLLQLGYCLQCSAWPFPWQVQHSQSNHIDRYLVCGERYQALRDAVGRAMMEGTAQGLLEAEKVQPSPPSRPLLGSVLTRPLLGFGWLQLSVPVGSVCSHGGTWGLLLGGHCGLCSSTRFLYFPTRLPHHCRLGQLWPVPCHILGSSPGLQWLPSSGICPPAPGHLPRGHCPVRCQGSKPSSQAAGRMLPFGSL